MKLALCNMCVDSEVGGRTMFRLLCRDAGGDTEQMMLNETVPPWVFDITVEVSETPFYGGPHLWVHQSLSYVMSFVTLGIYIPVTCISVH